MNSHLRFRWNRASVLIAAVTALLVVAGYAIVRAADTGHAGSSTAPAPVAAPSMNPCPRPATHPVQTAPGKGEQRTVALTFDDGPGQWTDDVLQVLTRENVKATFFVVGKLAAADADQVKQVHALGHAVQNHSWSHPSPNPRRGWTATLLRGEIRRTSSAISRTIGQRPCYFRPPEGVAKGAHEETRAAGLSMALWSVDTRDWATKGPSAAAIIRKRARAGLEQHHPMILMHDGGGDRAATAAALPGVIDDYRRHGYEFVILQDGRS